MLVCLALFHLYSLMVKMLSADQKAAGRRKSTQADRQKGGGASREFHKEQRDDFSTMKTMLND